MSMCAWGACGGPSPRTRAALCSAEVTGYSVTRRHSSAPTKKRAMRCYRRFAYRRLSSAESESGLHANTDNRDKGTDNRNKGTDNRNKGTAKWPCQSWRGAPPRECKRCADALQRVAARCDARVLGRTPEPGQPLRARTLGSPLGPSTPVHDTQRAVESRACSEERGPEPHADDALIAASAGCDAVARARVCARAAA